MPGSCSRFPCSWCAFDAGIAGGSSTASGYSREPRLRKVSMTGRRRRDHREEVETGTSQRKEIMKATCFERRLGELRSTIDLLAEPARSEFRTLIDELGQQYKRWEGNDAKLRLFMDDLRLIAKSVAFELDDWEGDIATQLTDDRSDGEPRRRLDCPATIEPHHHLLRRDSPEADASAGNA